MTRTVYKAVGSSNSRRLSSLCPVNEPMNDLALILLIMKNNGPKL